MFSFLKSLHQSLIIRSTALVFSYHATNSTILNKMKFIARCCYIKSSFEIVLLLLFVNRLFQNRLHQSS